MSDPAHPRLSVEAFEQVLRQRGHDRHIELIEGEIVEKMPNDEHGYLVGELARLLGNFLRQYKLGRVSVEVRLTPTAPAFWGNSRLPDLAVLLGKRPVLPTALQDPPDIAVEVQSPNESLDSLRDKADFYLGIGVREVWLVLPRQTRIERVTPQETVAYDVDEQLISPTLLPGFALPLREFFDYGAFL
jgi:Uma2 family endonuclease